MARGILERLLDPQRLDELYARTAQHQYTRKLYFSSLVELMGQVVLGAHSSVHDAYQARADTFPVSAQAIYDKLPHVEPAVAATVVLDSAQQVQPVIRAMHASHPSWIPGLRIKILDGNQLAGTEHRLPELRATWAAALPSKALVILEQATMTISNVFLTEDGHASEWTLLDDVAEKIRAYDLMLADRNLCTLGFLFGIARQDAFFAIRQHGQLKGRLLGRRKAKGRSATGRVYEQKLELTQPDGSKLVVRQVTVQLTQPTRDGETTLRIVTNLRVGHATTAQVADLYRQRWTIEEAFLEIATTLVCEVNTLGYPQAALFALCLALQAYNAVALLQAALRAAHGRTKVNEEVSGYYLALEITQSYDGMMIAIPAKHGKVFRELSVKELASLLREIAGKAKLRRYRKHPRGPKKPPPRRTAYKNGAHVSTAKLLEARRK